MSRRVIAIVAATERGIIGRREVYQGDGVFTPPAMPWDVGTYPEDMKRFVERTRGQVVIAGRVTRETIGTRWPLKNRRASIVVTSGWQSRAEAPAFGTVFDAIRHSLDYRNDDGSTPDAFIIGGAKVYDAAFGYLDEIDMTIVHEDHAGDVMFPHWTHGLERGGKWWVVERQHEGKRQRIAFERVESTRCLTNTKLTFNRWIRIANEIED